MTELTLILVSYHSQEPLARFFDSLDRHPIRARHEILVVDNAPGDGTAAWIAHRAPQARVLSMPGNVGYARAVNAGLAAGTGAVFLVINPDVELAAGAVDAALRYVQAHPEVGIAGARLLNRDGSVQRSARRFYTLTTILLRRTFLGRLFPAHPALRAHLMLDDDLSQARPVDWVMGAWMMVRRAVVERIGPMDGRFFLYFEDVDWCYRAWEAGYEVHYLPDAAFVHQYQRSSGRLGRTLLYHLRSFVSFYDKWGAAVYVTKHLRPGWEALAALLTDGLVLNFAFVLAFFVRRLLDPLFPEPLFDLSDYVPLWLFTNVVALVTLVLLGRYRRAAPARGVTQWLVSTRAALLVTLVVMSGSFLSHTRTFSRTVILLLLPLYALGLRAARPLGARVLGGAAAAPRAVRALLLGSERGVATLANALAAAPDPDLVLAGAAADPAIEVTPPPPDIPLAALGIRRLGQVADARALTERYRIGEVLVEGSDLPTAPLSAAARLLAADGTLVLVRQAWARVASAPDAALARHGSAWTIVHPPAACAEGAWIKSLLDRPVGALLCLGALPGFVLFWLLGVLSRQVALRPVAALGQHQRRVRWHELVWRHDGLPLWGAVQLPRFAQVLTGSLSLVGPFPLPPGAEEELGPIQLLRFAVRPGLTGLWQQRSGASTLELLVGDDLEYLERWSLTLDLDVFLSGLPRLLLGRGRSLALAATRARA